MQVSHRAAVRALLAAAMRTKRPHHVCQGLPELLQGCECDCMRLPSKGAGPGSEKMWTTVVSPKGAAMAKWETKGLMWPTWLQKNTANTNVKQATCVVQVFAAL